MEIANLSLEEVVDTCCKQVAFNFGTTATQRPTNRQIEELRKSLTAALNEAAQKVDNP